MLLRYAVPSAALLGAFAIIGVAMVALTHDLTAERIQENERAALLQMLHVLVPPHTHDNDLFEDVTHVADRELLGTPVAIPVFRATYRGKPVAAVFTPVAPDGYNGSIRLLVAVRYDGTLLGVRVIAHRETPGLGDAIEAARSDWIKGFSGRSLTDPPPQRWTVRRDGGEFEQFTGATITPRAVVRAVYNTLRFYEAHREALFAAPTTKATADD